MGFYERIIGINEPKIPVHQLMSAFGEYERNKVTAPEIATAFNLSVDEQIEVASLLANIITPLESISIGSFVQLTNIGTTYDNTNQSRGLGIARVQTAGITGFEFTVAVNKVGNGTQSWQLWNETDSTEITVINDSGATGPKNLSIIQTLPNPLGAAFKTLRIRALSTTAADDPIFFGACLLIQRVAKLSAEELHQILLLAEHGIAYNTVIALKTRLGV